MEELIRAFENAKMAIVGTTNLALESLDRALKRAMSEYKAKEQRLAELEAKEDEKPAK
jgi:hypothetical protein